MEPSCQICYSTAEDFESPIRWYSSCEKCLIKVCSSCQKDWSIEQISQMHIRPQLALTTFQAKVKCASTECDRILDLTNLNNKLQKADYDEIQLTLTKRLLNASEDGYMSCPKTTCQNIGWTDLSICCEEDYQCSECETKWRTKEQLNSSERFIIRRFDLRRFWNHLVCFDQDTSMNNIVNSLFGEKCPSCEVVIFRDKGCKFMKCQLCKYEWCWNCQDEFYTDYHFNRTNDCPFRLYFLQGIVALVACFLWLKLSVSFAIIGQSQVAVFVGIYRLLVFILLPIFKFVFWLAWYFIQGSSGLVFVFFVDIVIEKTLQIKETEKNVKAAKDQIQQQQGFVNRPLRRLLSQTTSELGAQKRARIAAMWAVIGIAIAEHILRDILSLNTKTILTNFLAGQTIIAFRKRFYRR